MNSFDDIFEGHISQRGQTNQPFDKEAWAEKKQAERQSVYDLADTTAVEVSADGSKFQSYLDVQTRFSRYSATNVLLILAQKPEATQLKDFNGWKEAGASIKRQQKGISILEPGEEYERADGSIGTSYNVKRVFDISQTTARAKVQPAISVDDRLLLKALISRSPVPMGVTAPMPVTTILLFILFNALSSQSFPIDIGIHTKSIIGVPAAGVKNSIGVDS